MMKKRDELATEISRFIEHYANDKGLSSHTLEAYRRDLWLLRKYLRSLDQSRLEEIKSSDLQEFVVHLAASKLSQNSQARVFSSVRTFFRYLAETGTFEKSLASCLETPMHIDKVPPLLSEIQIQNIIGVTEGEKALSLRNRALVETAYCTAARVSELIALGLSDLDLDNRSLRLTHVSGRPRRVPLKDTTVKALKNYLQNARPLLVRNKSVKAVFLNKLGNQLTRQGIWKIIRQLSGQAGIGETLISPSVLRNSCAAHLLSHGVPIQIVQALLGIADIKRLTLFFEEPSSQHMEAEAELEK